MKAYKIAMFIVLFEFSIPVAASFGFVGPFSGTTGFALVTESLKNPSAWLEAGVGLLGILGATRILGLRMNLGAAVFGVLFMAGSFPLHELLDTLASEQAGYLIPSELVTLIWMSTTVVFLFAFIQLASTPAKGAH